MNNIKNAKSPWNTTNDLFVYDNTYLYRTTFGDKLSAGKSTWQYMKVK